MRSGNVMGIWALERNLFRAPSCAILACRRSIHVLDGVAESVYCTNVVGALVVATEVARWLVNQKEDRVG